MQTKAFVASPIPSCLVGIDLVQGLEHRWQRPVLTCIPAAQTRPVGSLTRIQQWPRELCNEKSAFCSMCHSFSKIAVIIQKTSACETVEHFMFTALILLTTTHVTVVMDCHKHQVRMNFQRNLSFCRALRERGCWDEQICSCPSCAKHYCGRRRPGA